MKISFKELVVMLLIRLVFRIRDVLWKRLIVNVIVVVMKGIYGMILDVLLRGKSVVSVMKLDILNDSVKLKIGVLRGNMGEFIIL